MSKIFLIRDMDLDNDIKKSIANYCYIFDLQCHIESGKFAEYFKYTADNTVYKSIIEEIDKLGFKKIEPHILDFFFHQDSIYYNDMGLYRKGLALYCFRHIPEETIRNRFDLNSENNFNEVLSVLDKEIKRSYDSKIIDIALREEISKPICDLSKLRRVDVTDQIFDMVKVGYIDIPIETKLKKALSKDGIKSLADLIILLNKNILLREQGKPNIMVNAKTRHIGSLLKSIDQKFNTDYSILTSYLTEEKIKILYMTDVVTEQGVTFIFKVEYSYDGLYYEFLVEIIDRNKYKFYLDKTVKDFNNSNIEEKVISEILNYINKMGFVVENLL